MSSEEPTLSPEMQAYGAGFEQALTAAAGFMYPYRFGAFAANVWAADVRGATYARALASVQELAERETWFMTIKPGDPAPPIGTELAFRGKALTVHWWSPTDPLSGESIGACSLD